MSEQRIQPVGVQKKENQMEKNGMERCSLYYRNTQDNIFNLRLARMTMM